MAAGAFRKIEVVLLIAALAGAEVHQLTGRINCSPCLQLVDSTGNDGYTGASATLRGAPAAKSQQQIPPTLIEDLMATPGVLGLAQVIAKQMDTLTFDSVLQEQARHLALQMLEMMNVSTRECAKHLAEQIDALMANPGDQHHKKLVAERVRVMKLNSNIQQQMPPITMAIGSNLREQKVPLTKQVTFMTVDPRKEEKNKLDDIYVNKLGDNMFDENVQESFDESHRATSLLHVGLSDTTLGKAHQAQSISVRGPRTQPVDNDGISVLRTTANIVKCVVGAGVLSLPWSFYHSTLLPAVFFTVLSGLLAGMNFFYLGICSERTGLASYTEMWVRCFGQRSGLLSDLPILTLCSMISASFLIVAGDDLPRGLKGIGLGQQFFQDRRVAILFVFACISPLNFAKDLSILGYTSIIGTFGALYTCGLLCAESAVAGFHHSDWALCRFQPGWFLMISSLAVSLNGHFNAPQVYQELTNHSPRRWAIVTALAYSICTMITLACGVSGYLLLGSKLGWRGHSNVLTAEELQGKSAPMIAYIATTLSVALGYPICLQAARNSLESILVNYVPGNAAFKRLSPEFRRLSLSALCMSLSLIMALSTNNLGLLVAFNGAVGSVLMTYIYPSLMYMKCVKSDANPKAILTRCLPWMSIVAGAGLGVCGSTTILLSACGKMGQI